MIDIDNMVASLKYLQKLQKQSQKIIENMSNTDNLKKRNKLDADLARNTFHIRNEERKVWHKMKQFEVSLEPEMFHLSCMHTYKLWTPDI